MGAWAGDTAIFPEKWASSGDLPMSDHTYDRSRDSRAVTSRQQHAWRVKNITDCNKSVRYSIKAHVENIIRLIGKSQLKAAWLKPVVLTLNIEITNKKLLIIANYFKKPHLALK